MSDAFHYIHYNIPSFSTIDLWTSETLLDGNAPRVT